jgi:hypothetical protein
MNREGPCSDAFAAVTSPAATPRRCRTAKGKVICPFEVILDRTWSFVHASDRSAPLGENDTVRIVLIEKVEALDDPRVEAAADVLRNLLDDVTPVLEP